MAFSRSEWPLFGFFYKICPKPGSLLQVKPGVLHALGNGLFAVEASNRSNNTFRIFDHGRELSPSPRPLHYLLAAVSLSEESFVGRKNEGRYVFPYQDFAGTDNIRIKVFSAGELRKARTVTFPEQMIWGGSSSSAVQPMDSWLGSISGGRPRRQRPPFRRRPGCGWRAPWSPSPPIPPGCRPRL